MLRTLNSRFFVLCAKNRLTSSIRGDHARCLSSASSSQQGPQKRWSYSHSLGESPLLGVTIGSLLQQRVEQFPDREVVIFHTDRKRLTLQQLLEQADKLAAGLLSLGLQKGDRVGVWGPNTVEWVIAQYATARAGLVMVNINPMYLKNELEFAVKKSGCKVLIAAAGFKDLDYYHMLIELIPELASCDTGRFHSHRMPALHTVVMMDEGKMHGTLAFDDVMTAAGPAKVKAITDLQDSLQFDDPINIQFTSGTTGTPKGATLSHYNIVNNSHSVGMILDYHNRESRICCPVPLYHCFGMVLASLQIPCHGATVVFPAKGFDAGITLQAVQAERCTSLYGVPTMFIDMLNHPSLGSVNLSSLYTGIMAGSPCPVHVMEKVLHTMHMAEVTVCYGSTETSPVTFQTRRDTTVDKRVSTVGRVMPHVEAKIVDEGGSVVGVGETGELYTRGYTTMLGYWDDHDKTVQCISPDRWYHTGDQAVMDDGGYVTIVGRLSDMIIRGGENVYPIEVEQLLYTHPKVIEVQVVGVPDERLGEEICAYVQLKHGETLSEQELRDFCKGKIARYKIPLFIQFVDSFPMTVTGKIQKFKMRERAAHDLGFDHH